MRNFKLIFTVIGIASLVGACTGRSDSDEKIKSQPVPIESLLAEIDSLNGKCRGGAGDDPKTMKACEERDKKGEEAHARGWCWGPKNAIGADKHWMQCSADKSDDAPTGEWFGITDQGNCRSASIAEVVQMLELKSGGKATYQKDSYGFLQFTSIKKDGSSDTATLYPSCIDAISESNLSGTSDKAVETSSTKKDANNPSLGAVVGFAELKKMTVVGMENYKPYRVAAMINGLDLGTDALCERLRYDGYCETEGDRVHLIISLDSAAARSQLYDLRGKRGAAICATVVMQPRNVNGTVNLVGFTPGQCN